MSKIPALETALLAAEEAHARGAEAVEKLDAQIAPVRERVAAHAAAKAGHDAWRIESATLGKEPTVPDAKPEPAAPARERPTPEALAAAASTLRQEEADVVVRRERTAAKVAAEGRLASTVDALAAKRAALARVEALLVAVRRAPGDIIAEQVAALGDLGTLQIRALRQRTDRDPCIGAFVVGDYGAQPWESASDGEKVLADAYFRDAIARCRKATALPLIIDRANLYAPKDGGGLPRFTGPVWVLRSERTDDAGSIVVT